MTGSRNTVHRRRSASAGVGAALLIGLCRAAQGADPPPPDTHPPAGAAVPTKTGAPRPRPARVRWVVTVDERYRERFDQQRQQKKLIALFGCKRFLDHGIQWVVGTFLCKAVPRSIEDFNFRIVVERYHRLRADEILSPAELAEYARRKRVREVSPEVVEDQPEPPSAVTPPPAASPAAKAAAVAGESRGPAAGESRGEDQRARAKVIPPAAEAEDDAPSAQLGFPILLGTDALVGPAGHVGVSILFVGSRTTAGSAFAGPSTAVTFNASDRVQVGLAQGGVLYGKTPGAPGQVGPGDVTFAAKVIAYRNPFISVSPFGNLVLNAGFDAVDRGLTIRGPVSVVGAAATLDLSKKATFSLYPALTLVREAFGAAGLGAGLALAATDAGTAFFELDPSYTDPRTFVWSLSFGWSQQVTTALSIGAGATGTMSLHRAVDPWGAALGIGASVDLPTFDSK